MGCAASAMTESKSVTQSNIGQAKVTADVFKIADDVCFIPTDMLLNNAIQSSPKEQMRVAMQPNELIIKIGDMAVDLYRNQGLMKFKIAFYEEYLPKEMQQWMKQVHNFINVYIRRKTNGKLYGIYKYEIVNEEIEAYMCLNNAYYLGLNMFKDRPELDELVDLVSSYLNQSFNCDQFFIEMIYDPLIIPQQQIQQVLKEMSKCYGLLQKQYPMAKFTTVRKLNQMQLFSFVILIFDTSNINRFISGQFKFRVPSQFPHPISNSLRAQYEYKSLFTQLLTNATINDVCYYIIERINEYQNTIEIPQMIKFQESFMAMFSQIMCIQFPDVMGNKMLVASNVQDRYVTQMTVQQIDVEQRKKVEQLLQYIANLSGQQYKDVILGLYYTGDLNLNKIKSGNQQEEARIDDEMLNIRTEQANEIVFEVIDKALQQYFFEQREIITVDLSPYDPTVIKQHMVFIRKELNERLQGRDSVECGVTLDGDIYMRIFKDTHSDQDHKKRRRRKTRRLDGPTEENDTSEGQKHARIASKPKIAQLPADALDVDPVNTINSGQRQRTMDKPNNGLQMLFDGL